MYRGSNRGTRCLAGGLALGAAILALGTTPAWADVTTLFRSHIPMAFRVSGSLFPAGEYVFRMDRQDSGMILIQSDDDKYSAWLFTEESPDSAEDPGDSQAVFSKYGDQHYLRSLWVPTSPSSGGGGGHTLYLIRRGPLQTKLAQEQTPEQVQIGATQKE